MSHYRRDYFFLGIMSDDSTDSGVINNSHITSENEMDVSADTNTNGECLKIFSSRFEVPIS